MAIALDLANRMLMTSAPQPLKRCMRESLTRLTTINCHSSTGWGHR